MKVLIVAGTSLRYCPYANFYINLLLEAKIDFDVAYPDKAKLGDCYEFSTKVYEWDDKVIKYFELIRYKKFIMNLIKEESYDCVVVLTTVLAVLFCFDFRRKDIKYIVDIRDYTHEDLKLYYWAEKKAIEGAAITVISSPGFRKFLPKNKYLDVFNVQGELDVKNKHFVKNDGSRPICISYIGTISYHNQCERLMRLVETDERFVFNLYGNDLKGETIKSFIKDNQLNRSKYYGPYKPDEKGEIIEKADILFNAYGNDSPLLLYALSNKFADASLYLKPVLNSPGTSMHTMLRGCSFAIDLPDALNLDSLYEWYYGLEQDEVEMQLRSIRENMLRTNSFTKQKVLECIRKR